MWNIKTEGSVFFSQIHSSVNTCPCKNKSTCMQTKSPDSATIKWSRRFVTDDSVRVKSPQQMNSSSCVVTKFHDVVSQNIITVNGCPRVL